MRNPFVLTLFLASMFAASASASEFQIKGRTLGMSETAACGDAEITYRQADLEAIGVKGIAFPATSCQVHVDSVAGLKPDDPLRLLFWKGRLIRIIVRFGRVGWDDAVSLKLTFVKSFGRPTSTRKSPPFRTETWVSGRSTLELEWTGKLPSDVGAYLSDSVGWAEYQKASERATKAVNELEAKKLANDLRN